VPVYGDPYVNQLGDSIARWAVDAAAAAVLYLFHFISQPTDTIFTVVTPAYNRVLAMSLLLAGGVIAVALMERILGGDRGAGAEVVIRTLAACAAAMVGLPLMRYAVGYSDLLATAWNSDVVGGASALLNQVGPAYHAASGQAFGSALGLFLTALLTVLLAIVVHLELVVRAALIALTTTMVPLVCVMAIWPRLAGTVRHMVGFLVALLLSKFVIATAVYLGFAMVVHAYSAGTDLTSALVTGLATLTMAALAPAILFQGIRFAEAGAAHATRGFMLGTGRGVAAGVGHARIMAWTASRVRRVISRPSRRG
jgi:hypothetical protein